ncbi:MAG: bifunctional phosphopantothenoylcysteine decarboxylase/phosphopantothenate--cysteine ligase CoaBC [Muribaculaceae bacterium]|nr:bifunctional phosphopantothenoylcysteine decarboxylase/phosphopantothenate--cysteine ligase CoaBC [Muribaculaceae bacterium]
MRLEGKHIVLGISGGIAAYKSAALLRLLIKEGAEVQVVITPNGKEFITPATLAALSGKPVVSEFFAANTGEWHSHVDLGLWADLMVIAPATACTLAKMATGVADNMLITTYLSAKEPVMVAPAMDLDMFAHPSTQRNLDTLRGDGVIVLDSPSGELASGLEGKGRMLEPEQILEKVVEHFESASRKDFAGEKVVITAGPTREKIDDVRFIANHSSGKMGMALAEEFASRGADVTLVCGPVEGRKPVDARVKTVKVESALEMLDAVKKEYRDADVTIFAAAVADYRPEVAVAGKIKREERGPMTLSLVENPDIAAEMGANKREGQVNVGFALESDNGLQNAAKKLDAKNLDLIVLNPANRSDAGFNADTDIITLIGRDNMKEEFPLMTKRQCASVIANAVAKIAR